MEITTEMLTVGMRQVLAGLMFPAQRWQVIAQAQYYGAGYDFLQALERLPARIYHNLGEVLGELVPRADARPGAVDGARPRSAPPPRALAPPLRAAAGRPVAVSSG